MYSVHTAGCICRRFKAWRSLTQTADQLWSSMFNNNVAGWNLLLFPRHQSSGQMKWFGFTCCVTRASRRTLSGSMFVSVSSIQDNILVETVTKHQEKPPGLKIKWQLRLVTLSTICYAISGILINYMRLLCNAARNGQMLR